MATTRSLVLGLAELGKRAIRPIAQHRFKIERARYRGREILSGEAGNNALFASLERGDASAAGKIGGTEILVLNRWLRRRTAAQRVVRSWAGVDRRVYNESGVYPIDDELMSRFADYFLQTLSDVDVLAAWYRFGEASIARSFAPKARLVELRALEPYFHPTPWSSALAGKRVLVFSPFAKTIERQYPKRREIWPGKNALPDFTLLTMRAPLYPHMAAPSFPTWFDALEHFQQRLDQIDYDVLITGAGAWSVPLAAHAKRRGKWGIHMGGATQVLFGIRGRRWDLNADFQAFFNDAWTRPTDDEKPENFREMENGCYW